MMRFRWYGRLSLCALALASGMAHAWPSQPVTLIVPFAAGGMTDILARKLAQTMQTDLQQPVLVENRPGAGGVIGSERVARAAADGNTLLVMTTAHVVNPAIIKNLRYDAKNDFAPVAMLAHTPNVLVVHPSVPAKTLPELLEFARQKGGVTYGSAGAGGTTHLSGELLAAMTGAPFTHVPYKGTALAVNDLLGGQIDAAFVDALSATQYIESGRLRAIAVSTPERVPALPDVPTIAEQGVPGYDTRIWIGFYAPAGTPAPIVERLNALARKAMHEPQFQQTLSSQGTQPGDMDVPAFTQFVDEEFVKWARIVQEAGIEPQ
ncbi:tripartite tricarboxylate transporter substrate binding protein [Verticiella sediminum]|uniref:Tripartite tricarboxylate transporter substrate binding protein n=1 Tax=Verticiella sediminum TaxID=1247510 RepID=A0A556AB55_9BURK|nr:tripartite tricarboxylate transporter substrate binding protein [Verticiella sediminum]TSH90119.1 tripartite tricarboxylate transporter substrate binding protein [Verticiella sediminum]